MECTARMWCPFTSVEVAMIISAIALVLGFIISLLSGGVKRIHGTAGTAMGIDWAHYIIMYPFLFIFQTTLFLLFGIGLRWIL